ncbi:unnamed protein product, partial [Cochlearia groenlandica]
LNDYTQYPLDLHDNQIYSFLDFGSYGVDLHQEEPLDLCIVDYAKNGGGILRGEDVVDIDSGSSGGAPVKQEHDHFDEDCSRKRVRTGSCIKQGGTKACRERLRREKLNERFMDLSAVLEPGRTPKTAKPAILDDAIRVLNQLKDEAHELEETNQKLLEEIKSLKAEKHELREEKMTLKADKEKAEKQLKSTTMMVVPPPPPPPQSSGYMPPSAYNNQTKMAVYPSYGYMPMWHYLPQTVRDTSCDVELRPPAA